MQREVGGGGGENLNTSCISEEYVKLGIGVVGIPVLGFGFQFLVNSFGDLRVGNEM